MTKGRATATYVVESDVNNGDLLIAITVPASVEDWNGSRLDNVDGSVALGKFVAQLGVKFATVPTKAAAKKAAQLQALVDAGKTIDEANDIYDTIMGV